jgi:hypothetical protein
MHRSKRKNVNERGRESRREQEGAGEKQGIDQKEKTLLSLGILVTQ